jgi:hypothetical protein
MRRVAGKNEKREHHEMIVEREAGSDHTDLRSHINLRF